MVKAPFTPSVAIALDPSLKWAIEARDEVMKHIER